MKELIRQIINIDDFSQLPIYSNQNWDYLIKFCSYHELLPLLFLKTSHHLPPEKQEKFRINYYSSIARNMVLMEEFSNLKMELLTRGIQFLPLKGVDFLYTIYPDFNLRSMADIDILVPEDKVNDCEGILKSLGYKKILGGVKENYWIKYHCHFMYEKTSSGMNVTLELHWALDFKRLKNISFEHLWTRRRKITAEDTEIYVLSPEDTIIALALHQRRFHKPLILKNIIDGYLILKNHNIDWNYLIDTAYRYRLRVTLNLLLNVIEEVYGINFKHIKDSLRVKNYVDRIQNKIVKNYIYNTEMFNNYHIQKKIYFYLCFFLYDTWWEVVYYLFFIAPEKFAKFFGLPSYSFQNRLRYRLRVFYVPLRFLGSFLKNKM